MHVGCKSSKLRWQIKRNRNHLAKDAQIEICARFHTSELILRWLFIWKGKCQMLQLLTAQKELKILITSPFEKKNKIVWTQPFCTFFNCLSSCFQVDTKKFSAFPKSQYFEFWSSKYWLLRSRSIPELFSHLSFIRFEHSIE